MLTDHTFELETYCEGPVDATTGPGAILCSRQEDLLGFDGQFGDGSERYPYAYYEVKRNRCYRMRFIGALTTKQSLRIELFHHNLKIISIDGADVEPIDVKSFTLHQGMYKYVISLLLLRPPKAMEVTQIHFT